MSPTIVCLLSLLESCVFLAPPVHAPTQGQPRTATRQAALQSIIPNPTSLKLIGPQAVFTLFVDAEYSDGARLDVTTKAIMTVQEPRLVRVEPGGVVRALANGNTTITVAFLGKTMDIPVEVTGATMRRRYHFANDVEPILRRFGCNSSGCHGKAEGQNGFKLSVFGFDPEGDHAALVKEARGRRVFLAAPDHSLLLLKASGGVPHGGGAKISRHDDDYKTLRGWIAAGVPFGDADAPTLRRITVEPTTRVLAMGTTQRLRVSATWDNGETTDVTRHAKFQSNHEGLARVDPDGVARAGTAPGAVAIMASYGNEVATFRAIVPRNPSVLPDPLDPPDSRGASNHFVDKLVIQQLQRLRVRPAPRADDATFLRRVSLDLTGTLPTSNAARKFLADQHLHKREQLVDELLQRPEFTDLWALRFADLLRIDRQALGHKGAWAFYRWLHQSIAKGQPLDQMAREVLLAEGPLTEVAPAQFYRAVPKAGEQASTLAQVFLGARIACAECHHHPFDRWGQEDFLGMQAFFAPLIIQGNGENAVLLARGNPGVTHPRTGRVMYPRSLGEKEVTNLGEGERRHLLADWMVNPSNPFFARNFANRVWAYLLGRGLIEPVDDVRATNPPTHPELLDALASHLVASRFSLRALARVIVLSETYQRSHLPNVTNEHDDGNYSRALFKRPEAEILLDMVCDTTGVPEKFSGMPPHTRAVQVWDSKTDHYFLRAFGRPERVSACSCERNVEPSVAQVLHLLNSPRLHHKITHETGTIARLTRTISNNREFVDELYLTFYSRFPDANERAAALAHMERGSDTPARRQAAEDLAWSLLNTLEFIFNH